MPLFYNFSRMDFASQRLKRTALSIRWLVVIAALCCLPAQNAKAQIDVDALLGEYERTPVENEWHSGTISKDAAGNLRWKNKAGVGWALFVDNQQDRLLTANDCPYPGQHFRLTRVQPSRNIDGFQFLNDTFKVKGKGVTVVVDDINGFNLKRVKIGVPATQDQPAQVRAELRQFIPGYWQYSVREDVTGDIPKQTLHYVESARNAHSVTLNPSMGLGGVNSDFPQGGNRVQSRRARGRVLSNTLVIDLKENAVVFGDTTSKHHAILEKLKVSPEPVTGQNVRYIRVTPQGTSGGNFEYYHQVSGNNWERHSVNEQQVERLLGAYTAYARDEWSVYLTENSSGKKLKLDLYKMVAMLDDVVIANFALTDIEKPARQLDDRNLLTTKQRLRNGFHAYRFAGGAWTEETSPQALRSMLNTPSPPTSGHQGRNEDWYYVTLDTSRTYRFEVKAPGFQPRIGNAQSLPGPVQWFSAESSSNPVAILKDYATNSAEFRPAVSGPQWIVISTRLSPSRAGDSGDYEFTFSQQQQNGLFYGRWRRYDDRLMRIRQSGSDVFLRATNANLTGLPGTGTVDGLSIAYTSATDPPIETSGNINPTYSRMTLQGIEIWSRDTSFQTTNKDKTFFDVYRAAVALDYISAEVSNSATPTVGESATYAGVDAALEIQAELAREKESWPRRNHYEPSDIFMSVEDLFEFGKESTYQLTTYRRKGFNKVNIAVMSDANTMYVSIYGTVGNSSFDGVSGNNFNANLALPVVNPAYDNQLTHAGWASVAYDNYGWLTEEMDRQGGRYKRVIITGHSQGGAVAGYFTYLLLKNRYLQNEHQHRLVLFGTPRFAGTSFRKKFYEYIANVAPQMRAYDLEIEEDSIKTVWTDILSATIASQYYSLGHRYLRPKSFMDNTHDNAHSGVNYVLLANALLHADQGTFRDFYDLQSSFTKTLPQVLSDATLAESGDEIDVTSESLGTDDANIVELKLELESPVTWWKGIKVYVNGSMLKELEAEGTTSDSIRINVEAQDLIEIEVGKAKIFGVHTYYERQSVDFYGSKGNRFIFKWKKD